MTAVHSSPVDSDAVQLAALGYQSEFKRDMSLWQNFALGFTYLSPVVGVYAVFTASLAAGGPPMIWALLIAGIGQLFVAMIFGEVVAQFPIAGGVYPWARRLWGRKWAWMTGWIYIMALFATIAGVTYGAAPYTAILMGFDITVNSTVMFALGILLVATITNLMGTRILSYAAMIGFLAEIAGSVFVSGYLLLFERKQDLSVLFQSFGANIDGSYLSAFLAASLIGIFQYYGFEACGDVAEEVRAPGKRIPVAMRRTIYIGGAAATFQCLALILAVVDYRAVMSGELGQDAVIMILTSSFGTIGGWVVIAVVLLSFLSCAMSLQAAASRLIYAYARDNMIFGSRWLSLFSSVRYVPPYALILAAAAPALIVLTALFSTNAIVKIISFASIGIYIAFQMVVLAALRARLSGWIPSGAYTLGKWGLPVNVIALCYGVLAIINIAWPRTPGSPWYDNYIVILSLSVVLCIGGCYMLFQRPYLNSKASYADAIPKKSV